MAAATKNLQAAAAAAMQADVDLRDAITKARPDLAVAFSSAARLTADQAKTDAGQLISDPAHLTDEEKARLIAAGTLTPEQAAALKSGAAVTVPASQMAYLNEVARWDFLRAWPVKISGPSPKADSNEIGIEELTLAHEYIKRES